MRLKVEDRRDIARHAMDSAFAKRREDIATREDALGHRAWDLTYAPKLKTLLSSLPDIWLHRDQCLRFVLTGGRQVILSVRAPGLPVPPRRHGCTNLGTILDEVFCADFDALEIVKSILMEDAERARCNLQALLRSVSTVKMLRRVWPEGEAFYVHRDEDGPTAANLPAILVRDVNTMLGLPTREVAT